jgi:hypothetical protein
MKTILAISIFLLICPCRFDTGDLRGDSVRAGVTPYQYQIMREFDLPRSFGFREIDSVVSICGQCDIPLGIAFRMIYSESRYDSTRVNDKYGCWGYIQLNPKYFSYGNRFDNLRQGFTFLAQKKAQYGSWSKAVNYYGSGGAMACSPESIAYVVRGRVNN